MGGTTMTCGELLVRLLRDVHGVGTVFGIPGVHTLALYRGLSGSGLRHVSPRHEQGAGFMADGYARANGRPGVCFVITGPGLTNMTTAIAQAYADSVPMLVISSVNRRDQLGLGQGRLHELPDQRGMLAPVTAFSHTLLDPGNLEAVLRRAFTTFATARPRPVHLEIPLDVLDAPVRAPVALEAWRPPAPPAPDPSSIRRAAALLAQAGRPVVLLGGGCRWSPGAARDLVERLGAPVITTSNAKGLLPVGHPLDLGVSAAQEPVREMVRAADVVLAVGTEIGETDYDTVFDDGFRIEGGLVRIDIDPAQLQGRYAAALGIVADAGAAMEALAAALPAPLLDGAGTARAGAVRTASRRDEPAEWAGYRMLFETIYQALDDPVLVGDSTLPVYAGNTVAEPPVPAAWFNASTGYGTLGYALPAAIGARLAVAPRPVVALVGDGGLLFTLPELISAVEAGAPVIVLLWNNRGYEAIRRFMDAGGIKRTGVDLAMPDFRLLAAGLQCLHASVATPADLAEALPGAGMAASPTVIEIDAGQWMQVCG